MFVLGPLLHNTAAFVGSVSSFATLNPADITSGLNLTNGNLTVTSTLSGATPGGVRATRGISSGKVYWEVTIGANSSGQINLGAAESGADETIWWDRNVFTSVVTFKSNADTYWNGGDVASGLSAIAAADVLMFAYDSATHLFWVGKNGTWMTGGNPSAGTGGRDITGIGSPIYPAMQGYSTDAATFNFGATPYAYALLTGYGNV